MGAEACDHLKAFKKTNNSIPENIQKTKKIQTPTRQQNKKQKQKSFRQTKKKTNERATLCRHQLQREPGISSEKLRGPLSHVQAEQRSARETTGLRPNQVPSQPRTPT